MSDDDNLEDLKKLIALLEQRVETQEQIVAQLIVGYMDLAIAAEASLQNALNSMSEQERREFIQQSFHQRSEALSILRSTIEKDASASNVDLNEDTPIARSMETFLQQDDQTPPE